MYICKRLRFFSLESKLKFEKLSSEGLRKRFNLIELEVSANCHFYSMHTCKYEYMCSRSLNNAWTFLESEPFSEVVCPNLSVCMSLRFFVVSVQNRFTLCLSK